MAGEAFGALIGDLENLVNQINGNVQFREIVKRIKIAKETTAEVKKQQL